MDTLDIDWQKKKIVMVGLGYVGLVSAACFAEVGYTITCFDNNLEKIKILKTNKAPFFEPYLDDLLYVNEDRLKFTSSTQEAYTNADMIFIAVGTPQKENGEADLSYIYQVLDDIALYLDHDCIIITKSTVPVTTNEQMLKYLKSKIKKDITINIVSNPEFLAQGTAIEDMMHASRVVIGSDDEETKEVMKYFYNPFITPKVITSLRGAELIKYACNAFLATKISYMNDMANLCEKLGISIDDIKSGMQFDDRIGDKFLNAGIGYGGSCFSKDTHALINMAQAYGVDLSIIRSTMDINQRQRHILFDRLIQEYPSLEGANIGVLGVTYKPNTDDIRDAPSIEIINLLLQHNALVHVYDPKGLKSIKHLFNDKIEYETSAEKVIKSSDIILILTEWMEFRKLESSLFKNKIVFDGRNCLNEDQIAVLKQYIGIGKKK